MNSYLQLPGCSVSSQSYNYIPCTKLARKIFERGWLPPTYLRASGIFGRDLFHARQRDCFIQALEVDQVTHRPLIAAMQVVLATFSLGQKDQNVIIKEKRVIEKARGFRHIIWTSFPPGMQGFKCQENAWISDSYSIWILLQYCMCTHTILVKTLTFGRGQQPYPLEGVLQHVFPSSHIPPSGQMRAEVRPTRARNSNPTCIFCGEFVSVWVL